jgi:hypothetical protein
MAELELDLERLLAGDQNVGLAPIIGPAVAPRPAPQRWPLVLVGVAVLAGGVAVAVRRPAVAVQPAKPPAVAPLAPAAGHVAVPAAPPAAPVSPPTRKVHLRAERHGTKAPVAAPVNPETSDAVKRGVLPPASKEGYPDK